MKKKLLFVINTMGRAGAETALIELLKKLDALKAYELSLYAIIPCGELFTRVPENVRIINKGVNNGSLNSFRGRITIAREILFSFFYRLTGLKAIGYMIKNIREQKASGRKLQYDKLLWRLLADGRPVSEEEYDLAVAYIEGAAVYYLADKVNAKHKAAFIHIDYQKAGYTPLMDKDCYSGMDNIFVVSKEVGEKFCCVYPQYREKVRLFRNLLDQQNIREKAVDGTGFTDGFPGIRFVTVGRLHYQKGYDIAIEVLAKLREEGHNVRWYIIGEGAERRNLEMLTKKYGVEEYFILMGAKDNPYPYINQADIYVHATRFEGKSIAIEEAQILGKTIVASDCTGNREQIESGYDGILVELSVEKLVYELKRILKEPELQKEYAKHVLEKQLDYPEDLEFMLAIMNEEKRR
ncbi:glycosyltransferase [Anaerocolumna sp. AGMB13020]|uniref:glycosyltransferase n=1 Tax=Anaerocolumna sp. AGMB13020 TaxID=3081750 RepID=UPI0029556223|nr:glycosyltransferase [Anaerocolumna sp. AGMB13020]WOO36697.1 glycosyltransferase [Anaerocolumna sp. AGMB13020]